MTYDPDKWEVSYDGNKFTVSNGHGHVWGEYSSRSYANEIAYELNSKFDGD